MTSREMEGEEDRVREVARLEKRLNEAHRLFKASDRIGARLPRQTSAEIQAYNKWIAKRNNQRERYVALHRDLAKHSLPLHRRAATRPASLFDSHLLLPFEDRPSKTMFAERFFDNPEVTGRFHRNLMLYDTIFIPTVDLMILPLLYLTLGDHIVEALSTKQIVLVRYRGAVGYIGNGNGLKIFEIRSNDVGESQTEGDRSWASTDECLENLRSTVLSGDAFGVGWDAVSRAILDNIVEIDSAEFEPVAKSTNHEVAGHDDLIAMLGISGGIVTQMPGVAPNQVRWLGSNRVNDGVDWLLHLAQFNFESYMADRVGALDRNCGLGVRQVLTSRAARLMTSQAAEQGFKKILSVRNVPDFSQLHMDDARTSELWKLRASRESREFRRWFHDNVRERPDEAERLFRESTEKLSLGERKSVRALRYVAFTLAPELVEPIVSAVTGSEFNVPFGTGLALSEIDRRVVGPFLRPKGPKVMVDRLRGILPAPPHTNV